MVQTEAQYKFVYLAVKHYVDTQLRRGLAAEQKSQLVNIIYTSKLAGGADHMKTPH